MNLIEVLINLVTFIGGVLISPYVVKFMFEKIIQNKFDKNLEEFKSELTKINDKFNIEYSKLHKNRVN